MDRDSTDRRLLNLMQTEFPLTAEPYADLGRRLDTEANEIMQRIAQLKSKGIIRLIGPVLDSRSLGYQTTLVAMRVAEADLEKAKQAIAGHPGVSHGYERDHHFNVWFTLAVPPGTDIDSAAEQLARSSGAEAVFSLPAIKLFKIGAYFDMDEEGRKATVAQQSNLFPQPVELSDAEKLIINELQQDLPLTPAPFAPLAERAGMDVGQFLAKCQSLQQRGVIRRFSASINHHRAGFTANGMACWVVPADTIATTGRRLASLKEVSHCYERKTNPLWHYNLFAMIHGRSREVCQGIVDRVSSENALPSHVLLYSTREFKKARVTYLA